MMPIQGWCAMTNKISNEAQILRTANSRPGSSNRWKVSPRNLFATAALAVNAILALPACGNAGTEFQSDQTVHYRQRLVQSQPDPTPTPSATPLATKNTPTPKQESPALPIRPDAAAKPPTQAIANWQLSLLAHIDRFKRYPAQARGAEGVANLSFSIDRKGRLLSSRIVKSSGSAILDAETLALIRRAQPLPPPPNEVDTASLSFVVPINFGNGN
jgi:TonB family protein